MLSMLLSAAVVEAEVAEIVVEEEAANNNKINPQHNRTKINQPHPPGPPPDTLMGLPEMHVSTIILTGALLFTVPTP